MYKKSLALLGCMKTLVLLFGLGTKVMGTGYALDVNDHIRPAILTKTNNGTGAVEKNKEEARSMAGKGSNNQMEFGEMSDLTAQNAKRKGRTIFFSRQHQWWQISSIPRLPCLQAYRTTSITTVRLERKLGRIVASC